MKLTTLCYLEKDGNYLMLLRNKKKNDTNEGKWIGIGGKFEQCESALQCVRREVQEETGLVLNKARFRGIITFNQDDSDTEYMHLFTSSDFEGTVDFNCPEGELRWIPIREVSSLNLWEGDRVFLDLLYKDSRFFLLNLNYKGDNLIDKKLEFPEL